MFNIAVIVNTIAVLLGSSLGIFFGNKLKDKYQKILFQAVGLTSFVIGVKMSLQAKELLVVLGSMAIGGLIGHWIGIEERLGKLANKIEKSQGETKFVKGFVTATVLFLVGPMTILGCINSGLKGDHELLFVKSLMDGISSIILGSMYTFGVLASAVSVYVVQGLLVTFAAYLIFLSDPLYLGNFTATGGFIVISIGFRLLDIKDIKAGNFLPALFFSPLIDYILQLLK
ncbi:MAG: uncharacterized protein PWQ20_1265 [Thermotogaceae bacterium]|nr:uncharacterized protein [Thermotogaceae bacterium]MDN5338195.1 uncharacterized protein [Thermotogaceae bacterium]